MSKTDKTKPFWVKLMHGDLESEEHHNHADGVCDMPDVRDATAYTWGTTSCRRVFAYTGTHVCCCHWCHSSDSWERPLNKQRRLESKRICRDWEKEWGHSYGCLCDECYFWYRVEEEGWW